MVEVGANTICGTDLRIIHGAKTSGVRLPVVLGHELAGHVAEVGRGVRGYEVEAPVAMADDLENLCVNQRILQLALVSGARAVIVSEPNPLRRAHAARLGATVTVDPDGGDLEAAVEEVTGGLGIDGTVVAIGRPELVNQALRLARTGGRVNTFAGFGGSGLTEVESNLLHYKQVRLTGSADSRRADFETALRLIESGRIDTASMITHRFPLTKLTEAIRTVAAGEGIKVAVLP